MNLQEPDKELLFEFATAPEHARACELLRTRPELLTDLAEKVLGWLPSILERRADRERAEERLRLVRRAREVGVETASAEPAPAAAREPLHPFRVMQLLTEYLQAASLNDAAALLADYPELLDAANEPLLRTLAKTAVDSPRNAQRTAALVGFFRLAGHVGLPAALAEIGGIAQAQGHAQAWGQSFARFQQTGSAADLDDAIAHADALLASPETARLSAAQRLAYFEHAGLGLYFRYRQTGALADLDLALTRYGEARALADSDGERWRIDTFLGTLKLDRFERTGRPADLADSIVVLERAVPDDRFSPNEPTSVGAATSLGNALRHRYELTGDPADIGRAVTLHHQVAVTPAPKPVIAAIRFNNLGASLSTQFGRTGELAALDRALGLWRQALAEPEGEDDFKATVANNLGRGFEQRFQVTKLEADLRASAAFHEQAAASTPPGSPHRSRNLGNLGGALTRLYERTKDALALDRAVDALRQAVAVVAEGGVEPGRLHQGLSEALLLRYDNTRRPDDLAEARAEAERALELTAEDAPGYSAVAASMAQLLRTEGRNPAEVAAWYRRAVQRGLTVTPETALEAALQWGMGAIKEKRWAEAAEACLLGMDANEALIRSQKDRRSKEARIKQVQGLAPFAVSALAELGELRRAVEAAERGRAMLLAEALEQRGESAGRLDFAAIAALSQGGPLVYLDPGLERGQALVVKPASDPVLVWLPALTEVAVRERVDRFSAARETANLDAARWQAVLRETLRWLWQVVAEPLLPSLEGAPACHIIAGYYLPYLPLHAACREDANASGVGMFFSDRLLVNFAPSARALQQALAGARRPADTFLGIAEPQPVNGSPLPHAAAEVAFVSGRFDGYRVLPGRKATLKTVRAELPRHAVLHFACHGYADLQRPLKSGLALSEDRVLSLADCLLMRLDGARLAVLSACETGVMGSQLPDEVVSLPTGLLQAGVPGVVASLWRVGDLATALLMARFYELWRGESQPPTAALRNAQAWLRQRTNAELARHFASVPAWREALSTRPGRACDFESPEHWAGSYFTGA